jgi:anti-sigma factor RsiW
MERCVMIEQSSYSDWVDRYVRDELSDEEVIVFEEQLLEDSELQTELEAVLVMKETLKLETSQVTDFSESAEKTPGRNQWSALAMAASVLLAVVSTTFYWRASVETGNLQEQIANLQAPRASVLNVPVNIMRSGDDATPDVIIQKPAGQGAIVLDIELSARFQSLDLVNFELQADQSTTVLKWAAQPTSSGRASVVLNSELVPDGMVQLQMSDFSGELHERRLLEFRAAK